MLKKTKALDFLKICSLIRWLSVHQRSKNVRLAFEEDFTFRKNKWPVSYSYFILNKESNVLILFQSTLRNKQIQTFDFYHRNLPMHFLLKLFSPIHILN